jgi:hypothetical protein
MNHRAMGSTGRRIFIGAAFAGLGITALNARPQKPQVGATPMREFGKTGVKLTVVGQGWPCSATRRPHAPRCGTPTTWA